MSPVSVIYCQMKVSATDRSEFYRVCVCVCVSECDLETSTMRRPSPPEGLYTKMDWLNNRLP